MWIFIVMDFPVHRKSGRAEQKAFCSKIEKDGFLKMHKNLYARHSSTLGNALTHKKRVIGWVVRRCQVSILLVGDKQSEYAFHQLGYRSRKNADDLLEMPDNIEFF